MNMQAQLLRRKKWYTLDDAVRRLRVDLDETATTRDVLQLALDGDLSLFVMLHRQSAKKIINDDEPIVMPTNSPIFCTIEGIDMEPEPLMPTSQPVTVDDNSFSYLDGVFKISDASGTLSSMLSLKVMNSPDEHIFPGPWSVKDIGNDNSEWLIFDHEGDAPMQAWPDEASLMVLKSDIDTFVDSFHSQESCQYAEGEELRSLEAFGLLVDLYASQHGPDYWNGARAKVSRIVKDLLDIIPEDVTNMGDRKLKEHVGAAIKAWEAKKRR